MALALIVLAIGSVVAGYVGVPAALGGSNRIEHYLEPSFEPTAERSEAPPASELAPPGRAQRARAPAAEQSEARPAPMAASPARPSMASPRRSTR